jgi:hypothetical protein
MERNYQRFLANINGTGMHIPARRRILLLALLYGRIPNTNNLEII